MEEKEEVIENVEVNNSKEEVVQKLTNLNEAFFKKIDEKSGVFYFFIAIICFLIFVISIVYFLTKVKYDPETKVYSAKSGKNVYELRLVHETPYSNDFSSDTEDIPIEKDSDLSSLIYTEMTTLEETGNVKFNVSLPKINISSEFKLKDIEKIKNKIIEVNERVQTIRTIFEGDNQLNFNYYAYYYQNALSFGYSYYEDFDNNIVSDRVSFVYDVNRKKVMTFSEYLKSRKISEDKISAAIREIIRREKLKYKYNKRTKFYYIEPDSTINLIIDDNTKISIFIKE